MIDTQLQKGPRRVKGDEAEQDEGSESEETEGGVVGEAA